MQYILNFYYFYRISIISNRKIKVNMIGHLYIYIEMQQQFNRSYDACLQLFLNVNVCGLKSSLPYKIISALQCAHTILHSWMEESPGEM